MDNVYLNMDVGCLYPVERETPVLLLVVYEAFELVLIFGKVDAHRLRGEGGRKVDSLLLKESYSLMSSVVHQSVWLQIAGQCSTP